MKKHEYKNDYFYFIVRPEKREEKEVLIYCSGINVTRFLLCCRAGWSGIKPCHKRASAGEIRPLYSGTYKGRYPKEHYCNIGCAGNVPTRESWYTEPLLIENPGSLTPRK